MTKDQPSRPSAAPPADALAHFAALCEILAATGGKLEKRARIAEYLLTLHVEDAGCAAQYLAGEPFAEADGRQLSVGGALLSRAISALSGADAQAISQAYRRHGDLGAGAADLLHGRTTGTPAPTLQELEATLEQVAEARGPAAKLRMLLPALERMGPLEVKYTLKLISGDMRTGVKQSLVEEAVAQAWQRPVADVRHAGMLLGSLREVVERAAAGTLAQARMRLFHPLGFMLASPVDSVDEAITRFAQEVSDETNTVTKRKRRKPAVNDASEDVRALEIEEKPADEVATLTPPPELREAQLEDKYDGMRAQLHGGDPTQATRVGLFSRNREDLRHAFPELVEAFSTLSEAVILDGEILAWSPDADGGRALPFSALQQRLGRKQVSAEMRKRLPVVFMAFDMLYADGHLLLDRTLAERRARLERFIAEHADVLDGRHAHEDSASQGLLFHAEKPDTPSAELYFPRLVLAPAATFKSAEQLDEAYEKARERGNEGVMIKARGSLYQPGRRGLAWLKLKRQLGTLDVVVTGAEWGNGRRAPYLSDYTFAVRGPEGDLLNVGKAYSGVTDAEMQALSEHFLAHTVEDFGHFRTVEPDTVFEVGFNNIMRSSRHASGFALRFPRILRIRTDKPIDEIDTLGRVEHIYNSQPDRPSE